MSSEAKPITPTLSADKRAKTQLTQMARLDALAWGPRLWELPDRKLPRAELALRADIIHQRLKGILDIDHLGIPNTIDSGSTIWRVIYNTAGQQNNDINHVTIAGYDGQHNGTRIYIDRQSSDPIVEVVLKTEDGRKPIFAVETENAILIAEEFFDAMIGPWEEAYRLSPLPEPNLLEQYVRDVDRR